MKFSNKKIFFGILGIAIVSLVYVLFTQSASVESFEDDGILKAAIIDQLHQDIPNETLQNRAIEILEIAGYEVDLYTTEYVTVDFYKNLPTMDYDLVVMRTHGADDRDNNDVVLFTGERYQEDKYISEQLFGHVKKAAPILEVSFLPQNSNDDWVIVNDTYRYQKSSVMQEEYSEDEYFAISPKLVTESMDGKFNDTVFVLGGCETLTNPSLASSLVNKGASAVVGWDNTVGNINNDSAIILFLENYLINKYDIEKTVSIIQEGLVPETMVFPANFIQFK